MKNAFRVFFVDLFFGFTGREPEVRANKEPSENVDLFAIFWGVFTAKNKKCDFTSIKKVC